LRAKPTARRDASQHHSANPTGGLETPRARESRSIATQACEGASGGISSWLGLASVSVGVVILVFGTLVNYTERHRVAFWVWRGDFQAKPAPTFEERFCSFPLQAISQGLEDTGMVSLVGLKSTGKTSTVRHLLSTARDRNAIFVPLLTTSDVHKGIYEVLVAGIPRLPRAAFYGYTHGLQLEPSTHKEFVDGVFRILQEWTGRKVTLGLDLTPESGDVEDTFNSKKFINSIKHLAADAEVAEVIFAASEGLALLAVKEPRLRHFVATELELSTAKDYLRHLGVPDEHCTDELLGKFPRTFACLLEFANAGDRAAYAEARFAELIDTLKDVGFQCEGYCELYRQAQNGPVRRGEAIRLCNYSKQVLKDAVLATNIMSPVGGTRLALQFDSIKAGVYKLLSAGHTCAPINDSSNV